MLFIFFLDDRNHSFYVITKNPTIHCNVDSANDNTPNYYYQCSFITIDLYSFSVVGVYMKLSTIIISAISESPVILREWFVQGIVSGCTEKKAAHLRGTAVLTIKKEAGGGVTEGFV